MDDPWSVTSEQSTALVILAFLQSDCRNCDYRDELVSLGKDFNYTRDINCNGHFMDDGDLETDGHLPSSVFQNDILPVVELQRPRNHEAAESLHQVAEELREIAAQIEHNIVAQATRNLRDNISTSPTDWKNHLEVEVKQLMRQGVGLEHLPQERVLIALTLTLVRGVCEQVPVLLRNLFNAARQYINPIIAR
ncbi:BH3 interacting domain death agonist isoform X2 [Solea solea]|uniref:BH3 interacting domain death agonist isoform X2 n=1 Tax=Solea solea TaxID=90069 RepID=UPI00272DBF6F|nr:BH3 interacting domain death agonist isoform X2 [Solea solea]